MTTKIQAIFEDYKSQNGCLTEDDYRKFADRFAEIGASKYLLTKKEAYLVAVFAHECPIDQIVLEVIWSRFQLNMKNLFSLHPFVEKLVISTAAGKRDTTLVLPTVEELNLSGTKKPLIKKETKS